MRRTWILIACGLLPGTAASAEPPDLSKVDRMIAKPPTLTGKEPLYALLLFGPEAQTRVWLVLDKSKPDAPGHDVLYADLNGNGDLTEPGERFTANGAGESRTFKLPDFKEAASGATHTNFQVAFLRNSEVMVRLKWRGELAMAGGYPAAPEKGYLRFAAAPADAPVLWAQGDGPFRFQRWTGGKLAIGGADDLRLFVGQRGVGPSSFWAFSQHWPSASEHLRATVIYRDREGKERRGETCDLKERC